MKNTINQSNEEPVVYDTKDLQRILKCGQRQAYELMRSTSFPSIRLNSKHIISREKLIEWLNKNAGKTINF